MTNNPGVIIKWIFFAFIAVCIFALFMNAATSIGSNVAAWPSWNTPLSQATLRDVFGAAVILLIINWFLK